MSEREVRGFVELNRGEIRNEESHVLATVYIYRYLNIPNTHGGAHAGAQG